LAIMNKGLLINKLTIFYCKVHLYIGGNDGFLSNVR